MTEGMRLEGLQPRATWARRAQASLVDVIKRRALAALHATTRGEVLLLDIYLWAEEGAEHAALRDAMSADPPPWLAAQVARHLGDEAYHAVLLRERLRQLGAAPASREIDVVSRWKLRALERLGRASASDFRLGLTVPLFAVAYRMEAMGLRVLERHLAVLERVEQRTGRPDETREVLLRIASDERHHVEACARALLRLTDDDEHPRLAAVLARIDAVERAFGICGAVGLWLAGLFFRLADARRGASGASRSTVVRT
jgi:hypothetical protein